MATTAAPPAEPPAAPLTLRIEGMTCAACVARVERALARAAPGASVAVNLASEEARVAGGAAALDLANLVAAVVDAGYGASLKARTPAALAAAEARAKRKGRHELIVLAACILLTVPLVAPMIGGLFGAEFMLPGWVAFALATPVQFGAGARFYWNGWKALRARSGNMDLLVALGTSAAWGLGAWLLLGGGTQQLYFESAAVVITLVLLGRILEARARRSTTHAIRALMKLRPEHARVEWEGGEVERPLAELRLGDVVIVRPGERVAVDGEILEGRSHIDESLVTGESMPAARQAGDRVIGGTINGEGRLRIRATALGDESALARIIALVEGAQASKPPVQHLVDRVSAIFVPIVLGIAAVTLFYWLLTGQTAEASIIAAVSVLVIACPCALGLATPTAIMVASGVAARAGILIKDAAVIELAQQMTLCVFDKTGTLTEGKPRIIGMRAVAGAENEFLAILAAAQQGSEHSIGKAILAEAQHRGLALPPVGDFTAEPGLGITASVNGRTLRIGARRFMTDSPGLAVLDEIAGGFAAAGASLVYAAETAPQTRLLGLVAVADGVRPTAAAAVAELRALGIASLLLTGDGEPAAQAVARQVGITRVLAGLRPAEKAAEIERLRRAGAVVAMVGDGINDAPALAAADIGIAMGSGTEIAMEAAAITLMRPDPLLVAAAVRIARATRAKIRQNLFWAFIYNFVGIPLAAFGVLSPTLAGAAMAFSSVSVVANALLLRRALPRPKPKPVIDGQAIRRHDDRVTNGAHDDVMPGSAGAPSRVRRAIPILAIGAALATGYAVFLGTADQGARGVTTPAVVAAIPPSALATLPPPAATSAPPEAREAVLSPPAPSDVQPPAVEPPRPATPAWLRFAVPAPPIEGRTMIAIVIDDLGLDRKRTDRTIRLNGPLTLSFMAYAGDLPQQTAAAHAAGHELLLHVPMEPIDARADPGPNGLATALPPEETLRRLRWDLDRFPGYVGINNHMGSKFTSDERGMAVVIEELRSRGLLFLDSRTAATTKGEALARELGVPNAARDVFLDNAVETPAIAARLAELEQIARKRGAAIAIGHPHDATVEALSAWLPTLAARNFILVPLSAIVRQRGAAG